MNNPFEAYEQMIQSWQDREYAKLEKIGVDSSLLPLKLFLLGRDAEAQEALTDVENQFLGNTDSAFILEAKLVSTPFDPSTTAEVDLAKEIISLYDRAYFANITLANDYINRDEPAEAIPYYHKAIIVAPHSEKIISDLVYICILAERPKEEHSYHKLLKLRIEKIFAEVGLLGLSTKVRKVGLWVLLGLLSLRIYSLIVFIPLLAFFGYGYIKYRKTDNRLIKYVTFQYLIYLGIFTLLSLFLHFVL